MKLKSLVAAMALTCASGAALAQDYQFEIGAAYIDFDYDAGGSEDFFGVYGEYHFQPVRVGNNPLAEAAFINRSSNVYVGGVRDLDILYGGVDFYIPDTMFYVGAEFLREDLDNRDSYNDVGVRLGLTPAAGLLIWTQYWDEPGYDANIHAKYVMPMGGGTFLNIEGGYTDGDEIGGEKNNTLTADADFYFDQTFSVGVGFADNDGEVEDAFTLRTRKFFTNEISGQLAYTKSDYYDQIIIGASFRF